MIKEQLINKFKNKSALIGIIGLGYVGVPLMLRYSQAGFNVIGFDIDGNKVNQLKVGKSYIKHIDSQMIKDSLQRGLVATTSFEQIVECDAIILCVPTPLNKYREPDLNFVITTVESILPHLRQGQLLSLESTTYPGTTNEELFPRCASTGLKVGENFFLVYSPEREDPGNPDFDTRTIPKVVGGYTPACLEAGIALYESAIDQVVPVSSTQTAEMTKLLENIHRAVNIGLVNEMKIIADKMGIDIHEVVRAAATKPFGFTPFYPGPGWGGHCIPIDPFYLTWKAKAYGLKTHFIELAGEVNTNMPKWVIGKLMDALNDRKKSLNGSRVLILGITYKKNIDDMRESPSVTLMELLTEKGAIIDYSDPFVPVFPKMREHFFDLKSVKITKQGLKQYDCVILATDHDQFDYQLIREHARLILDTRGVYLNDLENIIKA